MIVFAPLFILGLLAHSGVADVDPKYQKPQTVTAVSYAGIEPNSCADSSFNVLTGQGDIAQDDCASIANGWVAEGDFVLLAKDWVNSTGDADHFYNYETQGTCSFAFKRTDTMQDDVRIGSTDLEGLVHRSIDMQMMQDGNHSAIIQPVEGVMGCNSTNGGAQIEWTIRKAS